MASHQHIHKRRAPLLDRQLNQIVSAFDNAFGIEDRGNVAGSTKTIYVTMAPTFSGSIAGYVTGGTVDATSTSSSSSSSSSSAEATPTHSSTSSILVASSTHATSSSALPTAILSPTSSLTSSVPITLAASTTASSTSSTSASPTSTSSASTSTGLTTGAKAGVAIGVIVGLGALGFLIFFFFRQRRNSAERQRLDDEKFNGQSAFAGGRSASTRTSATAPRLSLRPVTQFLPMLGNNRLSQGNSLAMASTAPRQAPEFSWDRPTVAENHDTTDPFGNHAELDAGPVAEPTHGSTAPGNGADGEILAGVVAAGAAVGLARGASKRGNGPTPMDFTKSGPRVGPPSPSGTEFSETDAPGTPTMTSGSAAIAAAGGPQNSAVHRVQLDFKPSMDDELGLRAGQLIRLLHEYDDGWALCIRLDRSQQGVVPRTCLSTRPVKPRPAPAGNMPRGPPPPGMRVPQQRPMPGADHSRRPSSTMNSGPQYNPQARPMTPNGRSMTPQGRPMTPQGRPMTPQGRPMTPQGRPMTPAGGRPRASSGAMSMTGGRPMTPNGGRPRASSGAMSMTGGRPMTPTGRPMTPSGVRSQSPSPGQLQERRITPPGPSAMNFDGPNSPPSPRRGGAPSAAAGATGRKPVPGQAI